MVSTARSMLLASLCRYVPLRSGYQLGYQLWSSGGKRCRTETVLIHADTIWLACSKLVLLSVDLESQGASYRHVSPNSTWDPARKCFEQSRMAKTTSIASAGLAVQGARARPSPFCEKAGHLDTLEHTLRETVMDTCKHIKCIPACMQSKSLDVDVLLEP